ncbi:MAG TPA: hypothetical protein ENM98_01340 [Halothiobacillaceae bacterium]|nr:hypothetical protein [Halothiobacillaceae bacterium]
MKNITLLLSLLLSAGSVAAQDLFSQDPISPAQQAPMQQSEPKITEYQDWLHICVEQRNQEICFIQQVLAEDDPRQPPLLTARIFADDSDWLQLILPLGVSLPDGILFAVDEGNERILPYQVCGVEGCLVEIELDNALLELLRGGREANILFRGYGQDDTFGLNLSLMGFTAATKAIGL